MNAELLLTIGSSLVCCGVTFGICKNKIDTNTKDIEHLHQQHKEDFKMIIDKQGITDNLLQDISKQLTELNTKMSLLLKGKINTGD